ncbi:unnamed protein product, partial [Allacma fusca]
VSTQQQSFRRRPQPLEVKLGETAILQCEVENQAGDVQWTKDGFALGKSIFFYLTPSHSLFPFSFWERALSP